MKILFQNDTSHTAYIGWTSYHDYRALEIPNVLLLKPYAEVCIETTDRYYLSVRIDEVYLFDAKIAIASKVVIMDDFNPYLMFYYDFDVPKYELCHRIPYGYSIHTWRAHYVQGDMMNKLELFC
jgi:hypothetical protein